MHVSELVHVIMDLGDFKGLHDQSVQTHPEPRMQ